MQSLYMWAALNVCVYLQLDLHASWQPPGPIGAPALAPGTAIPFAFGQVSAVAKGHNSDIWVFQRGEVVWNQQTFKSEDKGRHVADPTAFVAAPAVVQLHQVQSAHMLFRCCSTLAQACRHGMHVNCGLCTSIACMCLFSPTICCICSCRRGLAARVCSC